MPSLSDIMDAYKLYKGEQLMKRINVGEGELSVCRFPAVNRVRVRFDAFPGTDFEKGTPTCSHRFLELELSQEETQQLIAALQEA